MGSAIHNMKDPTFSTERGRLEYTNNLFTKRGADWKPGNFMNLLLSDSLHYDILMSNDWIKTKFFRKELSDKSSRKCRTDRLKYIEFHPL